MSLTSPDFESGAYTNFATPAAGIEGEDNKSNALRSATNQKMPSELVIPNSLVVAIS